MEVSSYSSEKKPLKTPFGHNKTQNSSNKKALSNPFGANQNYVADFDTDLNILDQSPNQSPALKNPYTDNSYGYVEDDTQLEGSISLMSDNNPMYTETNRQTKAQPQRRANNAQYQPNNSNDFVGFEPASQSFEPSFVKNNSILNTVMSFAGLFGNNQQAKNGEQAQEYDEENEPPLLEDLGIDPKLIKMRALSVLKFEKCQEEFVKEPDMSGPLLLVLVFGMLLLLSGKVHFGYIYGFGMIGTIGVYLMINLLSQRSRAQLYNTMSILGYCLFPIVVLSFFNVFFSLVNFVGFILALGAIVWSTLAATNFFEVLLQLNDQKWLVAYPVFLFYFTFVLITVF